MHSTEERMLASCDLVVRIGRIAGRTSASWSRSGTPRAMSPSCRRSSMTPAGTVLTRRIVPNFAGFSGAKAKPLSVGP